MFAAVTWQLPCRLNVLNASSDVWDCAVFHKHRTHFEIDEEQCVAVLCFETDPTQHEQTVIRILLSRYMI